MRVLLVAGPSACGKTTFLHQITLPDQMPVIGAHLPADLATWRQSAKYKDWSRDLEATGKIAVNYDTTRDAGLSGRFLDDPILRVLTMATDIKVITLKVGVDLLIKQITKKAHAPAPKKLRKSKPPIRRTTRLAMEVIKTILPGDEIAQQVPSIVGFKTLRRREKILAKLALYEQHGWLDGHYGQWRDFLDDLAKHGGQKVEQIWAEPDLSNDAGEIYKWKVQVRQPLGDHLT